MSMPLLSIVVTAHHEGELVEKSLRCLFEAAKRVKNVSYEFIVNVDQGDENTISCLEKSSFRKNFTIIRTFFGDPGPARNSAIKKAKGKYIALMDADDTVSLNWFSSAMKVINSKKKKNKVLIHPETEIRFNSETIFHLDMRVGMEDPWKRNIALLGNNRWCSIVFGEKRIFEKYEYSESEKGFGYEDYYFNCITSYDGVAHLVAPNTTAFLFQKEDSVTMKTHSDNYVLPRVNLFDIRTLQKKMKRNKMPEKFEKSCYISVPNTVIKQCFENDSFNPNMSRWIKRISEGVVIRNGTYDDYLVGVEFCKMINKLRVPHFLREMVFVSDLVEYKEYVNRNKKNPNRLFVAIGEADNIGSKKDVINFCHYFSWMDLDTQNFILSRLIIQLCPSKIIIGRNGIIREWAKDHSRFLKENNISVVYLDDTEDV